MDNLDKQLLFILACVWVLMMIPAVVAGVLVGLWIPTFVVLGMPVLLGGLFGLVVGLGKLAEKIFPY